MSMLFSGNTGAEGKENEVSSEKIRQGKREIDQREIERGERRRREKKRYERYNAVHVMRMCSNSVGLFLFFLFSLLGLL
jgi:hypothetical protein